MNRRRLSTGRSPRRRQPGFTLLELLLVLALLVVVYALASPALRGPLEARRLERGAEQVRYEWMRARNFAMRSGRTIGFQFRPSTGVYRMQDWSPPGNVTEGDGIGLPAAWADNGELPEGVTLEGATIDDSRSQYAYTDPQRGAAAGGQWSQPILFFPNGTASDATLRITGSRGARIELTLRGLTGTARRTDAPQPGEP